MSPHEKLLLYNDRRISEGLIDIIHNFKRLAVFAAKHSTLFLDGGSGDLTGTGGVAQKR